MPAKKTRSTRTNMKNEGGETPAGNGNIIESAVGKQDKEATDSKILILDPSTNRLIKQSNLDADWVLRHGFFPLEIARFLSMNLRDNNIPCEIGYDLELAESESETAMALRNSFRDRKPFYYVGFPGAYYPKAKDILEKTSYPLKDDGGVARRTYEAKMSAINKANEAIHKRQLFIYLMVAMIGMLGLYGFFMLAKILIP